MAEYAELIKALRCETEDTDCESCRYYKDYFCHVRTLQHEAAAAIEELQAEVKKYHDAFGRLSKTAVELEQRVVELRELPKRGEWSHVERVDRSWETDEIFGFVVQCSICGNKTIGTSLYCPCCGAKMEVQE